MKILKNDTVKILLGKDAGKTGKVLKVFPREDRVLVEGINVSKRHIKKTKEHEGGIIDISKPVNISNIALICPSCKKESKVGYDIKNGVKNRICKKCKEVIKNG